LRISVTLLLVTTVNLRPLLVQLEPLYNVSRCSFLLKASYRHYVAHQPVNTRNVTTLRIALAGHSFPSVWTFNIGLYRCILPLISYLI